MSNPFPTAAEQARPLLIRPDITNVPSFHAHAHGRSGRRADPPDCATKLLDCSMRLIRSRRCGSASRSISCAHPPSVIVRIPIRPIASVTSRHWEEYHTEMVRMRQLRPVPWTISTALGEQIVTNCWTSAMG